MGKPFFWSGFAEHIRGERLSPETSSMAFRSAYLAAGFLPLLVEATNVIYGKSDFDSHADHVTYGLIALLAIEKGRQLYENRHPSGRM